MKPFLLMGMIFTVLLSTISMDAIDCSNDRIEPETRDAIFSTYASIDTHNHSCTGSTRSPTLTSVWTSTENDYTKSVAWGDYNGDGDLDLACGNDNIQANKLYGNYGGSITLSAIWSSSETYSTMSVAWGDYDGDGDLDLACGDAGKNKIYKNEGSLLQTTSVWNSMESSNSHSIAWGDYDGDGDLDLASGERTTPNKIYKNEGGTLIQTAEWSSTETDDTLSIAWADYDNDGDLDLACGNYNGQDKLYRNDDGTISPTAVWSSVEANDTSSIAWGDYDGDGDLDLACGDIIGPNLLYRNDDGILTQTPVWSSSEIDNTDSVTWGDYDGDGDIDLAFGNSNGPNRIYRNEGGTLTKTAIWTSTESDDTNSVAFGDYDGDGDLDLACGNRWPGQVNRIYRNDGGSPPIRFDLLPNDPSYAEITTPSNLQMGIVSIDYTLYDDEGDRCRIMPLYSTDDGLSWIKATQGPGGDGSEDLKATSSGIQHKFEWNSGADVPDGAVLFKLRIMSNPDRCGIIRYPYLDFMTGAFYLDNAPPDVIINTENGTWFNTESPTIDVDFEDETGLDDGWYKVSLGGAWQPIFSDESELTFISDFKILSLSQGINEIYFKATDSVGNLFESSKPIDILTISVDSYVPGFTINTLNGIIVPSEFTLIDVDFDDGVGLLSEGSYKIVAAGLWQPIFTDLHQPIFTEDFNISGLEHGNNDIYFKVVDRTGKTFQPTDPEHVLNIVYDLPPVANAGTDQIVQYRDTIELDGRSSWDLDDCPEGDSEGTILEFDWNVTNDPSGSVLLSSEIESRPSLTAPNNTGIYSFTLRVRDPYGLWSEEDIIHITIGPRNLSRIEVEANSVSITVGTTIQLFAHGYDDLDGTFIISPTWEVDGGGTIDQDGLYHPVIAGEWTLYANASGISGRLTIYVMPSQPNSIIVSPSSVNLIAGDIQEFSAFVYDEFGNLNTTASIEWDVNGGGTIDMDGTFHAKKIGEWKAYANSSDISISVRITINPNSPYIIDILPSSITVNISERQSFKADIFDTYGNANTTSDVTWEVNGGGSITSNGTFIATTPGNWIITARTSDVSGFAKIEVLEEREQDIDDDKNEERTDGSNWFLILLVICIIIVIIVFLLMVLKKKGAAPTETDTKIDDTQLTPTNLTGQVGSSAIPQPSPTQDHPLQ